MRRALLLSLPLTLMALTAQAEDGMTIANELGTVLAAERPCHLSFDQSAIQQYINKRVPASDMSFGNMLQLMVSGTGVEIREMSPSTLTAFCAQTTRVARFNGFIR